MLTAVFYRATGADVYSAPTVMTLLQFTQSYGLLVEGEPQDWFMPTDPYRPINFEISLTPLGDVGFSVATIGAE